MIESILSKLSEVSERYLEIENLLSQPDITSNQENYIRLSKEYSELSPIVKAFKEYEQSESSLDEARQLVKDGDPDIREMAEIEIEDLTTSIQALEIEIKRLLLPKDPDDSKDVFLEVRAGAGGDEAALFAGDLFRMYSRLSERNNWNMDVVSIREGDHGGYKELVTRIEGNDVYKQLKFEAGVHRVQRVPATESQGRVHTSACSVAVLPEMDEIDEINIDKNDLRVDTYRASGAGGQHVNKTDSAVRLTHIPTGIVVECQDGRSQHKNKEKALSLLQSKLLEAEREKKDSEQAENRRVMVGSGDRSEKIRTYNFPQNRITDHRIEMSVHNLPAFLDGDMEEMISSLLEENQARALADLESKN
ncbi:MAG TPA: peptide chain release factor 1 [SAR86 cluster bacterium]|nr:peptide chain release factor 1 [SAR86 cluster bacterium]|tara:strand:+ start:14860 stop:15948 length:1089 start_codon:yes stop_codon:yes gene_type:complete